MHAVLTHRRFADAEAGEPLSLLWDLDLVALGLDSGAVGKSFVGIWWSDSSSILGSPAIFFFSSEMQSISGSAKPQKKGT